MVPPATEISSAFPDAIVESDEEHDQEESTVSTETLPDVMNELLRRKIITSPFKWCNNHTTELEAIREVPETTPSIESVICDFRKKISRIKPFSFAALGEYFSLVHVLLHF